MVIKGQLKNIIETLTNLIKNYTTLSNKINDKSNNNDIDINLDNEDELFPLEPDSNFSSILDQINPSSYFLESFNFFAKSSPEISNLLISTLSPQQLNELKEIEMNINRKK